MGPPPHPPSAWEKEVLMERFKEIKIFSNKISQSGLEGMLLTSDGELLEIREFGPRDEKGIPEGYTLLFDLTRQRPFYDVVSVNPETDPFGSMEESIRFAHQNIDTLVGTIESTWYGGHERYLVFKRKNVKDMGNSKGLRVALSVIPLGLILVLALLYALLPGYYLFAVCMASIAVYFLSIWFFHHFSSRKDFDAGQIRRAIATTFIFLFLTTLPVHLPLDRFKGPSKGAEQGALQAKTSVAGFAMRFGRSLDIMILTILGFYFGARVVENAVGLVFKKEKK